MKINILTIFPGLYKSFMEEALISRAIDKGIIEFNIIDFREYSTNKHHKVDDYSFGPGAGMVLKCQPIEDAILANNLQLTPILNTTPRGQLFSQELAHKFAQMDEITFLVGRYEGIDQRVIDKYVDYELSIGDFILMGGEIPSQAMLESIIRLIPGVINNEESHQTESFENHLLEENQYTRPADYNGDCIPEILISGHHENIEKWKLENRIKITKERRPDLYEEYVRNNEQIRSKDEKRKNN